MIFRRPSHDRPTDNISIRLNYYISTINILFNHLLRLSESAFASKRFHEVDRRSAFFAFPCTPSLFAPKFAFLMSF